MWGGEKGWSKEKEERFGNSRETAILRGKWGQDIQKEGEKQEGGKTAKERGERGTKTGQKRRHP